MRDAGHPAPCFLCCGAHRNGDIQALKILVTGGAGFIGSAVCRHLIRDTEHAVVNVDKLTYSANPSSLEAIARSPRYAFIHADICDGRRMLAIMEEHAVDAIL